MKSIAVITPNYYPETNAGARRVTAIAEHLAACGWRVRAITHLPHHPQNRVYDEYDVTSPDCRRENGVEVTRIRPWIVPRAKLTLRFLSEMLFCLQALPHVLHGRSTIILATSPYMLLGPLGLLASRLSRARFVWDVRDLTWQYAKATGKRSYGLDRPIEQLMKMTARQSHALTTATNGQLLYFDRRPKMAMVLSNGLAATVFDSLSRLPNSEPMQQRRPRVLYAGLLGYPQALLTLVRAAALLPEVDFALVGDGPERGLLEAEVQERNLSNVTFGGYVAFDALTSYYAWADILIAHLRSDPAFEVAQPSKLWEYMATGKPVIYAGRSEAGDIIREHDIGMVVPPEEPEVLAKAIRQLLHRPTRAAALGRRGQAFVTAHRSRALGLERLAKLLEALVSDKSERSIERYLETT